MQAAATAVAALLASYLLASARWVRDSYGHLSDVGLRIAIMALLSIYIV